MTLTKILSLTLSTSALALTLAAPNTARAGIDACGDIYVEAEASCRVEVEGGCTAMCEPPRLEAQCAAELYANCEGQCSASASVDCTASCQSSCVADCEVDPGSFDCSASCNADCQGSCEAQCGGDSECRASCEATCSAGCDARCSGTPPSATCEARCEASCEGSCEAQANIDCQVDCQAGGYVDCKADLQGGCEAQCQRPEGALFCDGQYVDAGNNLQECVAALEAQLNIQVDGYAEGSCQPGSCSGEAGGSISCAVDRGHGGWAWGAGLFMLGFAGLSRRRR